MKYCYFLILNFYTFYIFSQGSPNIYIRKVTPKGGMAYSQVTSIIEDKNGAIWFSTNNGLFMYNSKEIKKYSHAQNDSTTISTNRINLIYKDNKDKLWLATENGLCAYNTQKDNFYRYNFSDDFKSNIGKDITSFFQNYDGSYWFSDEIGFGTIDFKSKQIHYKEIEQEKGKVSKVVTDSNNNIWVIYNNGSIYQSAKGSNTFTFFSKGLRNRARTVFIDNNNLWIGYINQGVLCFNLQSGKISRQYNVQKENTNYKLPSNQVRSILKDDKDRIWIATYEGIVLISDYKISYTINENNHLDLPNSSIWSLYQDSQNNIWMGSWLGGLAFHSNFNNSIVRYNKETTKNKLKENVISYFTEIPNSNKILIALDNGGLTVFDTEKNTFTTKPIHYKNKEITKIKTITYDKKGTLWVGTYGDGVLYQEKGSTTFKHLPTTFGLGIQALEILALEDGIWVSDYPNGVYFYNFNTKEIKRHLHNPLNINTISNNKVHQIIKAKDNSIWFATENGLNCLEKESSTFLHYFPNKINNNSLNKNNNIYCIHEDAENILWIGTNGTGLIRFDTKTKKFENFTDKNKLLGYEIFSILEDKNNNLWLTTENGLCRFNKKTLETQLYSTNNNNETDLFYPISALKSSNDDFFFGGTNGFIRFSPSSIKKNIIPPVSYITNIFVNDKNIELKNTKTLELDHTQNFIEFHFASNNYINPKSNIFKYRLKNFSDQWFETNHLGVANFTNIPPGNFIFEIKTANNDGIWNVKPTEINIKIIPPFWQRWYSYCFYGILIVLTIYFSRKQLINRQKLKSEIKMEKVQRENEEELHQMKLQFFTNISHEFRTPLTLIQGPINRLLKTPPKNSSVLNQLILIKNNTDRLLRLINQLLDFRRVESGKLTLSPINTDIISLCKNVFNCFEAHATYRGFDYLFESDYDELHLDYDPEKLDKVLVNLLSNAFKYTEDNGTITFSIKNNEKPNFNSKWHKYSVGTPLESEFITISISDTGKGISEKSLPQIFKRFFQTENSITQGTGIGLSLSTSYITMHNGELIVSSLEKHGSTFCICIPKNQEKTINSTAVNYTYTPKENYNIEPTLIPENNDKIKNPNRNELVLIVEDNHELLEFLSTTLQEYYKIVTAKNGKEGLEKAYTLFPDLIISDIMMPEVNGIELCEQIKNDIKICHTPIILLTALDTIKDKIKGLNSGADAYLPKPFNEDILIVQIRNLLNSRKTLRTLFSKELDTWKEDINVLDLDKSFLKRAIEIVESNIKNSEFSVEDLAKKINLSRSHLHRKLTALTNKSASEFIKSIRLKRAVQLMKEGDLLISEIGYEVGFNSHNYFSKSFKKEYGKSPSEFIKTNLLNS